MKRLTREQVEARKGKAARFAETVVGDPGRADEIRAEAIEDYAKRRKFEITNPARSRTMARKTADNYREQVQDLKEQIRDLEEENETLQDRLDSVADIVAPEEEEEEQD